MNAEELKEEFRKALARAMLYCAATDPLKMLDTQVEAARQKLKVEFEIEEWYRELEWLRARNHRLAGELVMRGIDLSDIGLAAPGMACCDRPMGSCRRRKQFREE